jgi:hypothetical protein
MAKGNYPGQDSARLPAPPTALGWRPPDEGSGERPLQQPGGQRMRNFEPPAELDRRFGVLAQNEDRIDGLVRTEDVRALLDAFGLQDRTEIVFPFQHIKRRHGEVWRMRIEPLSAHSVEGNVAMAHHWVYMQDTNERVEQAQ